MNGLSLTALMVRSVGMAGTAHAVVGNAKAATGTMCRGPNGEGTKLAGEDPAKFIKAMQDYKSGARANPMMKAQAVPLSDDDNVNLAAYYASLK